MKTIKYPRTHHLPWSESITNDDRTLSSCDAFVGQRVVVTEKYDGENTTLYRNTTHARSMNSANHPSRNWVKGMWGAIRHNIPQDIRVCGENCYAKHSIHYTNLPSYFLGFSAWRDTVCLSWDETLKLFKELNIVPVNTLYDGIYDEELIQNISIDTDVMEGYVVRVADEFLMDDFTSCVGKYVRKGHVQTAAHWMKAAIIPNILGEVRL